ncbi:MAG: SIS domain-containing protein [Candidatus Omnitrophica bacterium]|nr:SIS domain-containing protein [Candidatus Omnitrophota bacterium]
MKTETPTKMGRTEMRKSFEGILKAHHDSCRASFTEPQVEILERIAREILKSLHSGRKILLCGNGGSAADAQHIAAELIGRFKLLRKSLPAVALTTDSSILTAVANDFDYEKVFARQVEGIGTSGDILMALSTSGQSKNVLAAVRQARSQGLVTIGFTGAADSPLCQLADICFRSQSDQTSHIQEIHIIALHAITEVVENVLFGS